MHKHQKCIDKKHTQIMCTSIYTQPYIYMQTYTYTHKHRVIHPLAHKCTQLYTHKNKYKCNDN